MTFNVTTADGKIERIDCNNAGVGPDGSLVCSNSAGPVAVYNSRWWRKFEPAALQTGTLRNIGDAN
jgi:hypothetical protein